jgi:hypothetical protein
MNWLLSFGRARKWRKYAELRAQLAVTTCAREAFDILAQIEALEMDGLWS